MGGWWADRMIPENLTDWEHGRVTQQGWGEAAGAGKAAGGRPHPTLPAPPQTTFGTGGRVPDTLACFSRNLGWALMLGQQDGGL